MGSFIDGRDTESGDDRRIASGAVYHHLPHHTCALHQARAMVGQRVFKASQMQICCVDFLTSDVHETEIPDRIDFLDDDNDDNQVC